MSRWFRHYAGMMRDDKLVRVAVKAKQPVERVVWVWGAILESAAEINDGGRYEFHAGEAAYFLRADETDLCGIEAVLVEMAHIHDGRVVKWGDRQYQSDGAAERQKRYRERRKGTSDGVRDDSDVTRDVTQTSRDGVVTPQETETETYQKEEPNGSSKKRGTRIPDDWMPDAADALAAGLPVQNTSLEASKFRDYWRSLPGQRGVKLDWPATWRNWCRKAAESHTSRPHSTASPNRKPNAVDAMQQIFAEKGWTANEPEILPSPDSDAQRLPADQRGPSGPLVDLRPGADWNRG